MVMDQLKNAFWQTVVDCLEQFHAVPRIEAKVRVFDLRSDIEGGPYHSFEPDIIYHDEPLYVAARLAGCHPEFTENLPAYRAIRERRFGQIGSEGAGVAVTPSACPDEARSVW
ncbi:MAG TPA: hypothetical protein VGX50_02685 [Longimicrobium sp.]|jgi:hypothetical protein|nr:hypothetical protein [Longimicrobium sp.]